MKEHKHVIAVVAAGAAEVSENPHHTDDTPSVFTLTPEQIALIKSLHFMSDYEVAHARRASPDVADAFDESAVHAIEAHAELGGAPRGEKIRALKADHAKLAAIAAIVGPIARLVGQALLRVDGALAVDAAEPLKVAHALESTRPELLQKLATLDKWSHAHHRHAASHHRLPPPPAKP